MKKFLHYLNLLFSIFLIINLFQMNFSTTYSTINQKNEDIKRQIEICCTWGQKLADGILTYEINNAKPELKELAISALNYWEQNITGIRLEEASSKGEQVDIKISFRNDNGKVAGQTITNFDSTGFIFNTH